MHRKSLPAAAARGFTLLEMMIVLVIIGVLGGVVAWNLIGASDKAKEQATEAKMKQVGQALDLYYSYNNEYPPSQQLVVLLPGGANLLQADGILDAWDRDIMYFNGTADGRAWMLVSGGIDGQFETVDDIVVYPDE